MTRIIVVNWVTLDGVMQGPGRADEDTRDGFADGGWANRYSDATVGAAIGRYMTGDHAWLFGRRSYVGLLASWNAQGGPFKDSLNGLPKYVATSDPNATLEWPNSTVLSGDVPAAVADLKQRTNADLVILGSGVLIASLMAAELIDEFVLMIAPIVLGRGRRMFADGVPASLRLLDCTPAETGAIVTVYALHGH